MKKVIFLKKLLLSVSIFLLVNSCQKKEYTDALMQENEPVNTSKITSRFFANDSLTDERIRFFIDDIRRQDSIHHFVERLAGKNGYPKWSEYSGNIETQKNTDQSIYRDAPVSASNVDTLMVFIPLRRDDTRNINTILACSKVGTKTWYKLLQRQYHEYKLLTAKEPEKFDFSTLALFIHFEKKINKLDSISIGFSRNYFLKNAKLRMKKTNGDYNTLDAPKVNTSDIWGLNIEYCVLTRPSYIAYARPLNMDVVIVQGEECGSVSYWTFMGDGGGGSTGSGTTGGTGGGAGDGGAGGGGSTGSYTGEAGFICPSSEWWCEAGDYRFVDGHLCTPDYYPYKEEGWDWLWWERPYTSKEQQILNELNQEDNESSNTTPRDCKGTQRTGNINMNGTLEHWLIMLDYISMNPINREVEYQIPGSSINGNRGYADLVDRYTGEIFEIKPSGLLGQGIDEVNNYVEKANASCLSSITGPTPIWKHGNNYPGRILPVPGNPTAVLESYLGSNGVVLYEYKNRITSPLPITLPQTHLEKIKNLINKLRDKVTDYDKIILEFLENPANREILSYLKTAAYGTATAIVVGTIIEDILTGGLGILDDWASFTLAYRIVRIASKL